MCHSLTVTQIRKIDSSLWLQRFFLPCGSWSCESCAKVKARKNGIRARKGFEGCRVRFMTLTAPTGLNITQMLVTLKASWNRLRTELTRNGKKLKYFWVLEAGEKFGRPHLHLMIDRYIKQSKLSKLAKRCGFGSIVDIRAVKDANAFAYVTKYLSKGMGSKAVEMALKRLHGRRVGYSRGFSVEKKEPTKRVILNIERPTGAYSDEKVNAFIFKRCAKEPREIRVKGRSVEVCIGECDPWDVDGAAQIAQIQSGSLPLSKIFCRQDRELLWGTARHNVDVFG